MDAFAEEHSDMRSLAQIAFDAQMDSCLLVSYSGNIDPPPQRPLLIAEMWRRSMERDTAQSLNGPRTSPEIKM